MDRNTLQILQKTNIEALKDITLFKGGGGGYKYSLTKIKKC